ncbi:MAG: CRISPR system precrRNA processing endoribonuclease RAMP protein Cas6 [Eubacterium sp.]|nr:CRISPR system precrRNA processing endoribonuclease RAMP protein Cas6 [Eubacterium sp.]
MDQRLKEALYIPYIKLHFEVILIEDSILPSNKVSALRGGMGDMLLQSSCVGDGVCEECMFLSECMMQKTIYSQYERKPKFVTTGGSIGYVIECENYERQFLKGARLRFNLLLFGKTVAYFHMFFQAFFNLGKVGIGNMQGKYEIAEVTNSKKRIIYSDGKFDLSQYQVLHILDYVVYRQKQLAHSILEHKLVFQTPVTLKYQRAYLQDFQMEPILIAASRRIYMLDCYIGMDNLYYQQEEFHIPKIVCQSCIKMSVRRYSQRRQMSMYLKGIKGYCVVEEWYPEVLPLLLAGELIHIGKNTSFGFGRYRIK